VLAVTFATKDLQISVLRELTISAMRNGQRVQFFPNTTDLSTYRWIDWPTEVQTTYVLENHLIIELPLIEQVAV
jgi:hypothetical protein